MVSFRDRLMEAALPHSSQKFSYPANLSHRRNIPDQSCVLFSLRNHGGMSNLDQPPLVFPVLLLRFSRWGQLHEICGSGILIFFLHLSRSIHLPPSACFLSDPLMTNSHSVLFFVVHGSLPYRFHLITSSFFFSR